MMSPVNWKDNLVPRKGASLLGLFVDIIDDYILECGNLECNGIDTEILNRDCRKTRLVRLDKEQD